MLSNEFDLFFNNDCMSLKLTFIKITSKIIFETLCNLIVHTKFGLSDVTKLQILCWGHSALFKPLISRLN